MAPPKFRDPRADRIYRRLLQIGKGPAGFFADAYQLMEGELPLESRSHFVGHALRELESAVRSVLAANTSAPAVDEETGNNLSAVKTVRHVVTALGLDPRGAIAEGWVGLTRSLYGIAHRRNLLPPRVADDRLQQTWLTTLSVMDELLDCFERRYADVFARLDRLAEIDLPTGADLDEFVKTIPHTDVTLDYFFGRLTSPAWFPGLAKRGAFAEPPPPDPEPDSGTVRLSSWAPAQYLRRVASDFPQGVSAVLASLETENVRVQEQAVEIAVALPPAYAEAVVPS